MRWAPRWVDAQGLGEAVVGRGAAQMTLYRTRWLGLGEVCDGHQSEHAGNCWLESHKGNVEDWLARQESCRSAFQL